MIAKFKSGKIIGGRLAETFTRIGLTSQISDEEKEVIVAKKASKKGRPAKKKQHEKDS